MSMELVNIGKLLRIMFLPRNRRTSILRDDIRNDLRREQGVEGGGGDFYKPFWADAKAHIAGGVDIQDSVRDRIERNHGRRRLYPLLEEGFLAWWQERRRWQNEPFEIVQDAVHGRLPIRELNAEIKVENVLALNIRDQRTRLVYPYFAEDPVLSHNAARFGLWALGEALAEYDPEEMRVLDVFRGNSFGRLDVDWTGTEREEFVHLYRQVLQHWNTLRDEYD